MRGLNMSATWNFDASRTSLPVSQIGTTTYYSPSPSPSPSPSSDAVPHLAFDLSQDYTLERTSSPSPTQS